MLSSPQVNNGVRSDHRDLLISHYLPEYELCPASHFHTRESRLQLLISNLPFVHRVIPSSVNRQPRHSTYRCKFGNLGITGDAIIFLIHVGINSFGSQSSSTAVSQSICLGCYSIIHGMWTVTPCEVPLLTTVFV